MNADLSRLVPVAEMRGDDAAETAELMGMFREARAWLEAHEWCRSIDEERFGFGVGRVVAVFLFRVRVRKATEWLWVVTGDLPPAYLVTDEAPEPADALEIYTDLMEDWIDAVQRGTGFEDVFPITAPRDRKHADMLSTRIDLLRSDFIPAARHGWD